MKPHIKEMMCQIAFLKDTILSPPLRKVVTNGKNKKVMSTPNESYMGHIPSIWERVDS